MVCGPSVKSTPCKRTTAQSSLPSIRCGKTERSFKRGWRRAGRCKWCYNEESTPFCGADSYGDDEGRVERDVHRWVEGCQPMGAGGGYLYHLMLTDMGYSYVYDLL